MIEVTEAQAKALAESGWWNGLSPRDICRFQLFEDRLCMDFGEFHAAVEKTLGRSVWTHEFGTSGIGQLRAEFLGDRPPPTMTEILNLIPEDKRVLVGITTERRK